MIQAVIFDFDGTLVDLINSDVSVLKYIHRSAGTLVEQNKFVDIAIREIVTFHELVDRDEIDPMQMHQYRLSNTFKRLGIAWDERYVNLYRAQLLRETKPYAGTHDLLSYLRGKVKLGIISNAYNAGQQRKRIEASGLIDYFQHIIIAGEVGVAKPDPEIFLLMSKKLGIAPSECLYIGDSIQYDIAGASSAGMKTVLLHARISQSNHESEHLVRDIQQLTRLIQRLIV